MYTFLVVEQTVYISHQRKVVFLGTLGKSFNNDCYLIIYGRYQNANGRYPNANGRYLNANGRYQKANESVFNPGYTIGKTPKKVLRITICYSKNFFMIR
jgi:hypothetical protein